MYKSIKKRDRFIDGCGGVIIEATGYKRRGLDEMMHVFRYINPPPGRDVNEICIHDERTFTDAGYKKMIPSVHPLIEEISEELRSDPVFCETLTEYLMTEDREYILRILAKHAPVEWLATVETFMDVINDVE